MNSSALNTTLVTVGLAAGALALTACGSGVAQEPDGAAPAETVTIENCGEERAFSLSPKAVVGMAPAQTELLVRLGVADSLAAQAQVGMAPLPEDVQDVVADVPVLGGDTPPSREELLDAEPDFVFSPTGYEFTAEQGFASMEQLEQVGAAAYLATGGCPERRMTGTVEDLFVDLENLGRIFEAEEAAASLEEQARAELDEVEERLADVEPVRMAQVYVDGESLSAIGAGIEYDIMARAGGDNVYAPDDDAFSSFFAAQITAEDLAAADPEAVVFAVDGPEQEEATRAYLQRTFPDLAAVRRDALIAVSAADTYPGALGNVALVRQVAEALHPEVFAK